MNTENITALLNEAGFPHTIFSRSTVLEKMRYAPYDQLLEYVDQQAKIFRSGNPYEKLLVILMRERLNGTQ